jgi:hypothetical protein
MKRYFAYLKSVLRHKYYVAIEGWKLGLPLWILIFHDWDKFLPSMFIAYARTFYDVDGSRLPYMEGHEFQEAWNAHQKRNKHHWQYWVLMGDTEDRNDVLKMPNIYIKEMIADWRGAGRAYGNPDTANWYLQHRDGIQLHPVTRYIVEHVLEVKPDDES